MDSVIYIINGPNLDLLGTREPDIYGSETLDQINSFSTSKISEKYPSLELKWRQSNLEGDIINWLHEARDSQGVIINPAGYSHSSVAIADALKLITSPVVEVHLSNVGLREEFRQRRVTAIGADITIEGAGKFAYLLGIEYIQLVKS